MKHCLMLTVLAASLSLVGCDPAGETAAFPQPAQAPYYEEQVLNTAEVMEFLMDPIYEQLKDAVENPPDKRKEWRALYITAYPLAETCNLLFSRVDEKKEYLSTQEWIDASIRARDVTVKLADSIKTQSDYEVIKANFIEMMNDCNECHRKFEPGEVDDVLPPASWGMEVEKDPDKVEFQ